MAAFERFVTYIHELRKSQRCFSTIYKDFFILLVSMLYDFGLTFKELRKQWRESGSEEMTETADEQETILREGVGLKLELSREELGQKAAEDGKELGPDDNAVSLLAALQHYQEQEAEYLMRDLAVKVP